MTRKKNKKDKKQEAVNSHENSNIFLSEKIPATENYSKKDKTIDIPNYADTLEKAKAYINRLNIQYNTKLDRPYHLQDRKPTLQEFEAISTHCMGNLSEMALYLDCNRITIRLFLQKEENKEYYELFAESKYSFNDFAVSKLKENVAGVKVLGYDKLGHEKVYDRPPDTKAIEFALRNNKSFEEWEWQNTSKTQNTNLNIDVNQLIQSQLEKMDINELKQYTKSLLNDIDIKGLIE